MKGMIGRDEQMMMDGSCTKHGCTTDTNAYKNKPYVDVAFVISVSSWLTSYAHDVTSQIFVTYDHLTKPAPLFYLADTSQTCPFHLQ